MLGFAAQARVEVELPRRTVAHNESLVVRFKIHDAGLKPAAPDWTPLKKDFSIARQNESASVQIVNGVRRSLKTYELEITPRRAGRLTIPALQFGSLKSQAQTITVTKNTPPPRRKKSFYIEVKADPMNPYVQQQTRYTFKLFMARRLSGNVTQPESDGQVIVKPLGKEKNYRVNLGGMHYDVYERRFMLFPQASGELIIKPIKLTGAYIERGRRLSVNRQSKTVKLKVRAVPAGFKGKFWLPAEQVNVTQKWSGDLSQWVQGEPMTRVVSLTGTGLLASQLPKVSWAEVSGFNNYADPKPKLHNHKNNFGFIGERSQEFVLIPTVDGSHRLPAVSIPWWNTRSERLEHAVLPPVDLQIRGADVDAIVMEQSPPTFQPEAFAATARESELRVWIWLSMILGAGWLATLAVVGWKYYAVHSVRRRAQLSRRKSLKRCLARLQSACEANDKAAAGKALLQWGKIMWPDRSLSTLGRVAACCSRDLGDEIRLLDAALYGEKTWSGVLLSKIIVQEEATAAAPKQTSRQGGLEPLHRLS